MKISLFDLHCDTLSELYNKKLGLTSNSLHISLDKTACYENYGQIAALWSNPDFTPDECYRRFFEITDYFKNQLQNTGSYHAGIASDGENTAVSFTKGQKTFIYSVEGGTLLNSDLTRLDELFGKGVRILTLVWNQECCIGGAFDTNEGLTPFGEKVAEKCFEIGIIPDISHSSDRSAFQLAQIAEKYSKPFIASHSNSRSVFAHPRNLTDELFNKIMKSGGVAE
jgi:membrane dipeptidase